ncbi:hypothetical protein GCM10023259_069500 [Thermocatellispora tengchongensis]
MVPASVGREIDDALPAFAQSPAEIMASQSGGVSGSQRRDRRHKGIVALCGDNGHLTENLRGHDLVTIRRRRFGVTPSMTGVR